MNTHYIIAHNKEFDFIAFFYSDDITDNFIKLLNIFNIEENKNSWDITESYIFDEDIDNITFDRIKSLINSSFKYFNDYTKIDSNTIKLECSSNTDGLKYYIFVNSYYHKKLIDEIYDKTYVDFYDYIHDTNLIKIKQVTIKDNILVYLNDYCTVNKECNFKNIAGFVTMCPTTIRPEIYIKLNKFERKLVHFIYFLYIPDNFMFKIINTDEVIEKIEAVKSNLKDKYIKEIKED